MVRNFQFIEEDQIAISAVPETPEQVDWLHEQGIRAVVSLHPVPDAARERMAELGIQQQSFHISDFAEGVPEGLPELLRFIEERVERDPSLLIHCFGGGGRSGTIYAAYLVNQGLSADQALTRASMVEKAVQKAFLYGYAAGKPKPE